MLDARTLLVNARNRITKPENWTCRRLARIAETTDMVKSTIDGEALSCSPLSPAAVCWCVGGAVSAEAGLTGYPDDRPGSNAYQAMTALSAVCQEKYGNSSYIHVNDFMGHEAILQALDETIFRMSEDEEVKVYDPRLSEEQVADYKAHDVERMVAADSYYPPYG